MVGRFYAPALGRPLQPHSTAAPPTIPQALNRYAATPVGQPGVYAASGGGWQANLWDTTKGEVTEGIMGAFLGNGLKRYASTAGYGRLLATIKNVHSSAHSSSFRPYYFKTPRNHHISHPVKSIGRATYQDQAGAILNMGRNQHSFVLGLDDGLKQLMAGEFAQEFAGGAIIELAFALLDIREMTQNPYLNGKQKTVQGVVIGAGALTSAGLGAGAATVVAGAPVAVVFGVGVVVGVGASHLWNAIVPPAVSWFAVHVFQVRDPYQNNRNLEVLR